MLVTDVVATVMVMAEAKEMGWTAGLLDMVGWYVSITTTSISVSTLSGHNTMDKVWVLLLVGGSNVFGTKLGQITGSHFLKSKQQRMTAAAARSGR